MSINHRKSTETQSKASGSEFVTKEPTQRDADPFRNFAPDLISDDLRSEVARADSAKETHRKVREAASEARNELQAALNAGEVEAALSAAAKLASTESLVEFLPPESLDPAIVSASLANALEFVRLAETRLPRLPIISYSVELAGYRSLPSSVQQVIDPPVRSETDLAAIAVLDQLEKGRQPIVNTINAWRSTVSTGTADVLQMLATASDIADMITSYEAESKDGIDLINKANQHRVENGFSWTKPQGYSSRELRLIAG